MSLHGFLLLICIRTWAAKQWGVTIADLDTVLERSDIISFMCLYLATGMIDSRAFEK